jgi:DNA-binding IclR family transcriptional regulator
VFDEIYTGSAKGSVYLLVALIELACALAEKLSISKVARDELSVLARRTAAAPSICSFPWPTEPGETYPRN